MSSVIKLERQSKLWTKDFTLITIINAFAFMGFNMATGGIPVFLSDIGYVETLTGLATTFSAIAALVIRPFAGFLIGRLSAKRVCTIGFLLMFVPTVLFSSRTDLRIILVIRICQGLGWGLSSPGCSSIIAQTAPASRLSEGIGYSGALSSVTTAFAPTIAITLTRKIGGSAMLLAIGMVIMLAFLLLLLLRVCGIAEVNLAEKKRVNNCIESYALFPALLIFFVTISYSPIITFVAQFAKSNGLDNIYPFFISYALATIVSRPLIGIFTDKKGCNIPVFFSLLSAFASVLLLYFSYNMYVFCIAGFFSGVSMGMGMNSLQTMAFKISPPNRKGIAMSTLLLGFDLGMAVGASIAGLISKYLGYRIMYGIIVLFPFAGLILFVVIISRMKHVGQREKTI